jgi:hypothetical protein
MAEEFWAKVELLGHVTLGGRVCEVERFGAKLGRIDVPQEDGTFVTQFFSAASVYRITVVTEEVARLIGEQSSPPISPWDLPSTRAALASPIEEDFDDDDHQPEDDDR